MYQAKRIPKSEFIPIRNLTYHTRVWGAPNPALAPMVLVHGWMDVAASYQFLVDAFSEAFVAGRHIIAPDWRGYGLTTGDPVDNYWFADYLADLDFLLDHYAAAGQQVDLVGHSLGGNVVMHYAGARPERIRRLINLEGFGTPAMRPTSAPKRLATWMDELKAFQRGEMNLKPYDNAEAVAQRLMKTNPRLARDAAGRDRAIWLAHHWAAENKSGDQAGKWDILGDAAHKITGALLIRVEEVLALYAANTAPTLFVEASENSMQSWYKTRFTLEEFHERLNSVPALTRAKMSDCGHMLHHDQPAQLARLIEDFVA
jgi:pimeloyl-ACP methyl ester carboxylesterase